MKEIRDHNGDVEHPVGVDVCHHFRGDGSCHALSLQLPVMEEQKVICAYFVLCRIFTMLNVVIFFVME